MPRHEPIACNFTELAELTGRHPDTIRKWARNGMPYRREGKENMILLQDFKAWFRSGYANCLGVDEQAERDLERMMG